jgi:hypothetical protein
VIRCISRLSTVVLIVNGTMCHRTGRVEVAQGCGLQEQCAIVEVGEICGDKETRPRHQALLSPIIESTNYGETR